MANVSEALHWHRTGAAFVQGFLLVAAVVTVAARMHVAAISGRVGAAVPIFSRVGLIPLWPNVLAVSHPSGSPVKGQVASHAFGRRKFIPPSGNWCHWNDIPQLVVDVAVCKMVFRGRGHDAQKEEAAGEASPAAIGGPDTRTVLLGHHPQFANGLTAFSEIAGSALRPAWFMRPSGVCVMAGDWSPDWWCPRALFVIRSHATAKVEEVCLWVRVERVETARAQDGSRARLDPPTRPLTRAPKTKSSGLCHDTASPESGDSATRAVRFRRCVV